MKFICFKFPNEIQKKNLIPPNFNWQLHNKYLYWCIQTMDARLLNLSQFVAAAFGTTITKALLISKSTKTWLQDCFEIISNDLSQNQYLQGDNFSLTDIVLCFTLSHCYHAGFIAEAPKSIQDYYSRCNKRPAYRKAVNGAL